ncbi:methyl-accepting chemotaxis protein [Gracilibacillus timonensis]|uniref:methyl-accepting chemotaxis protein n=1 Tax=Gracilibacillus timonensis TaxID=1816696 RepID=UPI0008265544|nr:methyl-accepting chemotaxis protein [Gracilibacillus timonensis]
MKKLSKNKYKIPAIMLALLIIPSTIVGYFSYQQTEVLEKAIIEKDDIVETLPKYQDVFNTYEQKLTELSELEEMDYQQVDLSDQPTNTYPNMPEVNDPLLTSYYEETLSDQMHSDDYMINLYIGTTEGALYLSNITEELRMSDYNATEADWYRQAIESPETVIWSKPYIDNLTGNPVVTFAKTIYDENNQVVGVLASDFDMHALAMQMRQDILQTTVITLILSTVIGLAIIILFVRVMNYNIKAMIEELDRLSSGDLSGEKVKVKGKDEFADLADSLNKMKDNLYVMINQVMIATGQVMQQGTILSQASDQVKQGSEQIAATMEELASGTESQASHASDLATSVDQYNLKVKTAAKSGTNVSSQAQEMKELSEQGRQELQVTIDQMKIIYQTVHDSYQRVSGLDRRTEEIDKIVVVIKEIAEQTNLLALNAAIEAARAGEAGNGFAVVADEVRKLAEQVTDSVTDITGLVGNIQTESNEVASSLENGFKEVEKGTEQIGTTGESFQQINTSISGMVNHVELMVHELELVQENSQNMKKSVDEIAAVSEESAAAVQETAASAEQANQSMDEVSKSAVELDKSAENLEKEISKFKII